MLNLLKSTQEEVLGEGASHACDTLDPWETPWARGGGGEPSVLDAEPPTHYLLAPGPWDGGVRVLEPGNVLFLCAGGRPLSTPLGGAFSTLKTDPKPKEEDFPCR